MSDAATKLTLPSGRISTDQSVDSKGRRITRIVIDDTTNSRVQPNRQSQPGPIGNAPGKIYPDTESNPNGRTAPAIVPTPKEKGWWERWGSDVVHGALDVGGFFPVLGAIPDLINAGVYAAEGNYAQAGISAVAAIPFGGDAVAAGNIGVKVGKRAAKELEEVAAKRTAKELEEQAAKRAAKEAEQKAAKEAEEAAAKKGGKDKGNPRCILRPYRVGGVDTCKPDRTGHHVVPDRVFRVGKRGSARIDGGIPEDDGLVICVDGANLDRSKEHGQIHALYDKAEVAAAVLTAANAAAKGLPVTPGTAPLGALEVAGALAAGKVTGCNPLLLEAQLRAYHKSKGLDIDAPVRADPTGKLPVDVTKLGKGATPSGGPTR
jgi:hypothetical protein